MEQQVNLDIRSIEKIIRTHSLPLLEKELRQKYNYEDEEEIMCFVENIKNL